MKKFFLPILLTAVLFSPAALVFAQTENPGTIKREDVKSKIETRLKETKAKLASKSALRKEKLEAVKLRVCETKKSAIVRRSTRLAERAARQMTNFDQKAQRVENFYNNRLVPSGVTLDNYGDLLADVEAKRQAVNEATTSAKTSAEDFDCSGDDPKGQLANFRIDMQNAIAALKEFRTSIKNLIVAVRTANAKVASDSADN